jgi:hypothetical protein
MKPPVAVDVPVEILETIISYLPRWAVASLAVVSRSYYRAARNVLYRTLDLGIVGPERAEQLYALLAHRRELAHGVRTLICDDWPTASSRTPTPSSSASAFRAALSNMHNLTALTIPSFNSTILHDQLPFSLTRLTLLNVTMPLDEQVGLFEWLDTQAEITYLAFPNLIEKPKNDVPDKTKYHGSRLLFTVPILTPVSADLSGTYPLSSTPFGSPFLLPVLTSLHAPPIIATLLAPVRSLKEVTVHIQTTIYSGLRPSALMGALHGVQCLTVRFGENIDKRSVEKVLSAAGAVLGKIRQGSESLEILEVEVKWSDDEVFRFIAKSLAG